MRITPRRGAAELESHMPGRVGKDDDRSLAANEPSIGPSLAAREAIVQALDRINRYPDPLADTLRQRLGDELHVDADQILVGNGSDELIYLLCLAYLPPGGSVVCADPPYRLHELVPQLVGAEITRVPLVRWAHDLPRMADVLATFAFICNPHNPTGTALPATAIQEFVNTSQAGLIVVDEAYIDFATQPANLTVLHLAKAGEVVVVRTFSKLHALAGVRVGYLVGPADIVSMLRRIRAPFSVNSLGQAAAEAALADSDHRRHVRDHILATRPKVRLLFEEAGYKTIPSEANFVLVLTSEEEQLVSRLWHSGISVRPGKTVGLPGGVRVTLPSEHGLSLLEKALASGPGHE